MKNLFHWLLKTSLCLTIILVVACSPKTGDVVKNMPTTPTAVEIKEELAPPAEKPGVGKSIPVDPEIRMGTLENGMRYMIKYNSKPENRAELRLVVDAGAMQEDEDQQGLAHFVEHMAFNGSTNFEKNDLVDYLESIGTRFGPDLNAYTSFDETVYMIQARTDEPDMLNKGLLILEDWAQGISFDHEEIDKERGVVESEWRTRLSGNQRMQNEWLPVFLQNSRYAKRLPIGKPEIIRKAPYETIKRFYKDWYRSDLMSVVVVGDVDIDAMELEIKNRFSKVKESEVKRKKENNAIPNHKETLVSINTDKEAPFTNIQLTYKHQKADSKDLNDYRSGIVRRLYNSMLNSRLDELTQSPTPPFTYAYTGYSRSIGPMDTYSSYAQMEEGGAAKAFKVIVEENERVLRHGFASSELERQKVELLSGMDKAFKEKDKTESRRFAGRYVSHLLKDTPIPNIKDELDLYTKMLPGITVDEVNALASKWMTDENRVIIITAPEKSKETLPTEEDILNTIAAVKSADIKPYVDEVSDEPLLGENLTPVGIKSEKTIDIIGVTELVLDNNVKVVLKQTDFKNDEVLMRARSEGGHSIYSDEDYPSAMNAASIIDESGVGNFDLTQLQKKLAGKVVSVSPYIGEMSEGINGTCSPDDLETFLQLTYLYFTAPRKDENAFKSFISKQTSIYKNVMSDPRYYFADQVAKLKYQNHRRRGFPTVQDFEQVDLDRVFEIYKDRFADASDFTFVFVGNFDLEKIKPLLATYLGNLPSINREEKWKDVGANYIPGKLVKRLKKGKAPKSQIDITYHGDFEWSKENKYNFNSLVKLMSIKMRESMREDKGGVYGVRVRGNTAKYPEPKYSINISFNSDPANADDLIKTAQKDIMDVFENGADEKNITKIKETQKQGRIKGLKENNFWISQLVSAYAEEFNPEEIEIGEFEKLVDGLNSQAMKEAAMKYFKSNKLIQVVMDPETTTPEN